MNNLLKDCLLAVILMAEYFTGRIVLLRIFNANFDIPSIDWYVMSLRFDIMTAAYIAFPTILLSIISIFLRGRKFLAIVDSLKVLYANVAVVLSAAVCVVNTCFFGEYKSQFNHWIFGLFFDDIDAILSTIIKDYPLVWIAVGICAAAFLSYILIKFSFKKIDSLKLYEPPLWGRILLSLTAVLLAFTCMRGGTLSGRPLQFKDASVEPSPFLNNIIPTPMFCLKQEISNFLISENSAPPISEKDFANMSREIFRGDSPDIFLERTAKGKILKNRPSHIFLIIGEGHSAWPTFDKYQKYSLMPETRSLYKKSFHCKKALPSGMGTMASVSSMASGIPFDGLDVRGVPVCNDTFSPAALMKRLGYSSVFYYAGQSSWMQLGDLLYFEKFDNVVGMESMGKNYPTKEWGLRDKDVFDYIVKSDIPKNSFCTVLTVSNHPPFDIDLKSEGLQRDIKSENEKKLWHMWYADKQIGSFVERISEKYPNALIIISGDHPARTLPEGENMSASDVSCVPIIFAGKPVEDENLGGKEISEAQHLDIIPTLVEMLAPEGFKYRAWGHDLRSNSPRNFAPMNPFAIFQDGKILPFNSAECTKSLSDFANKYYSLVRYISLQRTAKKDGKNSNPVR